jgi:hypothetical protein
LWRGRSGTACGSPAARPARDAFIIIADAARSLPHTLWPVGVGDETLAELDLLVGFDDDLAGETIRIADRIRGCGEERMT